MFVHASLRALYQTVWFAATPFLRCHARLREGFGERVVPPHWPYGLQETGTPPPPDSPDNQKNIPQDGNPQPAPDNSPPEGLRIWMQAASGGEATLVRAIAHALRQKASAADAPLTLVTTTCTAQGLSVLLKLEREFSAFEQGAGNNAVRVLPRYFPLDAPATMRRALAQASPHLIVLLETELWPGLLHEAKQAGIPYMVLNGRMTEKSVQGFSRFSSFFLAHPPCAVTVTTEGNAKRFCQTFGLEHVEVVPNIKFALALDTLDALEAAPAGDVSLPTARELAGIGADVPLAVFASVRKEEEEALFPAICALAGMVIDERPVCCIVAPRHMHRVRAWKKRFERAGISVCLRSSCNRGEPGTATEKNAPSAEKVLPALSPGMNTRVVVWDTFGEMRAVYTAADTVAVGGSFAPLGGQNFLEPLAAGVLPLTGPSWENFDWVGNAVVEQGLLQIIPEPQELVGAMLCAMRTRLGPDPLAWQADRAGAAEKVRARFRAFLLPFTHGAGQNAAILRERLHFAMFG